MQALVKSHDRLGISIQNKPIPKIGSNDVLVKVKYAAICGTDVSIYKWTEWAQKEIPLGTTLGHEFVGNIIEKGTDVTGIEIGDLVTAECHGYCQKCSICLKGYKHLCVKSRNIGIHVDGAFAQYVLIPQQNIVKLNEISDIDHRILALLDPLGNAVHCMQSFSIKNASILIIGAGPIGLMLTSILKHSGNNTIVMIDYNIYRLQIAKALGADLVINLNQANETKDEWLDYILQEKEFDFGFAPLELVTEHKKIIGDKLSLFIDGGFSRGEDIFKAIALGADAVLIGRAMLWALALKQEAKGVLHALNILRQELIETMLLAGCSSLNEINHDTVYVNVKKFGL